MADDNEIMVATRVNKPIYAKLLKRQREAERLTGVTPSVSALVRALIAEGLSLKETRRRKSATAATR